MAYDVWKGPGGSGGKPTSGDFTDGANWSTGTAPSGSVNAVMGPGNYSVSLTSASYSIGALTVGTGVTFHVDGPDNAQSLLTLTADSTNSGVISVLGSVLSLASSVTLLNVGTILGIGGQSYVGQIGGGVIQNEGLISTDGGPALGDLAITNQILNDAGGIISTSGGGRTSIVGSITNDGLVSAVDGGLLTFSAFGINGSATNFVDGVLTGGQWTAAGAGSTLTLYGLPLTELGSGTTVTLASAGSVFEVIDASGTRTNIETSLSRIDDSASLVITDRDYTTGQDLDLSGRLTVNGGVLTSAGLTIHDNTGSTLTGYGVVDAGSFDIYGSMGATKNAAHQTLDLDGDARIYGLLFGKGTLEFSSGQVVIEDGAQVLAKSVLISGATLELGENLVYDKHLTMTGGQIELDDFLLRLNGATTLGGGAEIATSGGGVLQIEGGQVKIASGGATIDSALRNDGSIDVAKGSLTQLGAVNGMGEFTLEARNTLTFGGYVSDGQQVTFAGRGATLDLQDAHSFHASVAGFAAQETIRLEGFATAGEKLSFKADADGQGGTLKLTSGADTASFHLEGQYAASGFHLADDGQGGTNLTYAPPAAAHAASEVDAHADAYPATHDAWVI